MNEFRQNMYTETGFCPKCGEKLMPVLYYQAQYGGRSSATSTDHVANTITTTTTTTYYNVTPCLAGYCMKCAAKDHDAAQNRIAAQKPNPTFLIVCIAILIIGFSLVPLVPDPMPFDLTFWQKALVVSLGVTLVDIPVLIVALVVFLGKRKTYEKYREGYRAPFVPPDDKALSKLAVGVLNLNTRGDTVYLDIEKRSQLV